MRVVQQEEATRSRYTWRHMALWAAGVAAGLVVLVVGVRGGCHLWLYGRKIPAVLWRYSGDPPGPPPEDGIEELGGRTRAAEVLRQYLKLPAAQTWGRVEAYYLLSCCEDGDSVLHELIAMLNDPRKSRPPWEDPADPSLCNRMDAADALWHIGSRAEIAVPALTGALDAPEASVRYRAVRALGRIGPAAGPAVPHMVRLLADRDVAVRRATASAFRRLGPVAKPAIPELRKGLLDGDDDVRYFCRWALEEIEAKTAGAPGPP